MARPAIPCKTRQGMPVRAGRKPLSGARRAGAQCLHQAVPGELLNQAMRSGERQPCPAGQLRQLEAASPLGECSNEADHPVHHRIAGS